jgi:NADH:quinone reductase (non-electrogenic)
MPERAQERVLILGGGFAGMYAALEFERILGEDDSLEVTLVNEDNFFLFTPMLHEVAASDLDPTAIVNPVRKLLRRVRFFNGRVERIDLAARRVLAAHGGSEHPHEFGYDHLVIALGSTTNFFGIPGLAERALTMRTLGDAIALRNRLIQHLEEADFECSIGSRKDLLTVVVAGAGFAGVETVAGVNDFLREAIAHYPNLTEESLRVVLVDPVPEILPELGGRLGPYARKKLTERQVEVRLRTGVRGVTDSGVELSDGTTIPTRLLVWAAGNAPNPLVLGLPCPLEKGRLVADDRMRVPGRSGLWALGDCASVPDPKTGKPHPPTAQHALRQGRVLARNVYAAIRGKEPTPFRFSTSGQLAAIGRRTGVARIFGFQFSGFVAWWLWRTIYLSKLPRLEKKVRVLLDWTLDLFFSKDLVQHGSPSRTPSARREAGLPEVPAAELVSSLSS